MRFAVVNTNERLKVESYMPDNYRVIGSTHDGKVLIAGEDSHGWTLDGYVIPRLGSGLLAAEEVSLVDLEERGH